MTPEFSPHSPTLEHALDGLPAAVYLFRCAPDGQLSFPFVSAACAAIYGFSAEAAMNDVRLMHDAIHPEDRESFHQQGQRSQRAMSAVRWEGRIVRSDRQIRHIAIASVPHARADGSIEWHGVVVDRTEATDITGQTTLESIDRHCVQRDLLGMLGHDLGSPLSAITTHAEAAQLELDALLGSCDRSDSLAAIGRTLEAIERQARRLDLMRRDILAQVQLGARRLTATAQAVNLRERLDGAIELLSEPARVEVQCPRDMTCLVQPSHLDQMLTNLLHNADKYSNGTITAVVIAENTHVRVTISDLGRDDSRREMPDDVFEPFIRADSQEASQAPGSGLGLYIVRELAAANGGSVAYEPRKPRGSHFHVLLPVAEPAPMSDTNPRSRPASRSESR